jgi:hypothetical protein
MLKSEAISTIQRHLAFRTDLENEALIELKQAQNKFEREGIPAPGVDTAGTFLPWFLLTEMATVSQEANEERIPLPSNFLAEAEESGFFRYAGTAEVGEQWKPLTKIDIKRGRTATGSEPKYYARSGIYFRLFPMPQQVVEFRTVYYAADALLDDTDSENKWLKNAPDLLIAEAGWHLAGSLRDKDAIGIFEHMKAVAARRLFFATEDATIVNMRLAMGGLDD